VRMNDRTECLYVSCKFMFRAKLIVWQQSGKARKERLGIQQLKTDKWSPWRVFPVTPSFFFLIEISFAFSSLNEIRILTTPTQNSSCWSIKEVFWKNFLSYTLKRPSSSSIAIACQLGLFCVNYGIFVYIYSLILHGAIHVTFFEKMLFI
jgi:hypothetical protein